MNVLLFFSRESDSTIANVCSSVSPSEIKTPQPLRIKPICHYAYLLISQIPISHHANQLSCQTATMPPPTQPLCQLAIIPIPISHHHAYWPIYLSICPAFATSKPFRLVFFLSESFPQTDFVFTNFDLQFYNFMDAINVQITQRSTENESYSLPGDWLLTNNEVYLAISQF